MQLHHREHFGMARKIVSNMTTDSWRTIPHACATYRPEVTAFFEVLREINEGKNQAEKITVNTALLRVIVEGLKACPKMNSHIHFNRRLVRGRVDTFENIDISMPVLLKTGDMITLTMRGFEQKTMSQMRDAIRDTLARADNSDMNEVMFEVSMDNTVQNLKRGKLLQTVYRLVGSKTGKHRIRTLKGNAKKAYYSKPVHTRLTKSDIEQGTITVSNMGSIYRAWSGECTLLEIIPPQVVAIGIGARQTVPVCRSDGSVTAGTKLPMTIAFDHRALDMGDIVPFMQKLDGIFAHPSVLKDWV